MPICNTVTSMTSTLNQRLIDLESVEQRYRDADQDVQDLKAALAIAENHLTVLRLQAAKLFNE